jgi:hypothetical protein
VLLSKSLKKEKIMMENKKNFTKNKKSFNKKNFNAKKKPNTHCANEQTAKYFYPKDATEGREFVEYRMPKASIIDLLASRDKLEMKMNPQKFLCDYVNNECGLMGYCVRVIEG